MGGTNAKLIRQSEISKNWATQKANAFVILLPAGSVRKTLDCVSVKWEDNAFVSFGVSSLLDFSAISL